MQTLHPNNHILKDDDYIIGYVQPKSKRFSFGFFCKTKTNTYNGYIDKKGKEHPTCGSCWHKTLKKAYKAIEKHKGLNS